MVNLINMHGGGFELGESSLVLYLNKACADKPLSNNLVKTETSAL